MGGGTYSTASRTIRSTALGYGVKTSAEIFTNRQINNAMSPHGIMVRESRDSAEHPNSLAIILALDVTGSMGSVPHYLVKEGLPHIMDTIIQSGIPDPQLLFLGIGDHECDKAPLQVGQFESSDELLDKWLTDLWLEGGGGGNAGESYHLAWYFAAQHTSIDCFEKRNKKGYLFTVGDEPVLRSVPQTALKSIMGDGQFEHYTASQLYERASEKYHVFHIHVQETASGGRREVVDSWKQIVADHLILAPRREDVSLLISKKITEMEGHTSQGQVVTEKPTSSESSSTPEDVIL